MIAHTAKIPTKIISPDITCGTTKFIKASDTQNSSKAAGNRYVANALPPLPLHYTIGGWGF